ncbi:MAG: SAM-dependent methyltransferase [Candidatus Micrarchaeaceae archaeon]
MLYFVQIAQAFEESAVKELKSMARFRLVDRSLNNLIIETKADLAKKFRSKNPTFIYCAFPIAVSGRISGKYAESIYALLLKAIYKSKITSGEVIKLECFDINSRRGYSAKDLEVLFGTRLIKDGYRADLLNPDRLVYLVLMNERCYVGQASWESLKPKELNPLRRYSQQSHTSRAEVKLAMAFEAFSIKQRGLAIDLGAAPGGWSKFLALNGFKVIAVDNAYLDYKSLKAAGLSLKKAKNPKEIAGAYGIIHFKSNAGSFLKELKCIRVDLLANDMNMDSLSSSEIAAKYAKFMRKGATLIMTIKCMSRNAPLYIRQAKKALSKEFLIKGIKALPANRQELTLYGIKK